MRYEVNVTEEFERWWDALSIKQREAITARVQMVEERGPGLARPVVDQVSSSRHKNMKELRCSSDGALRVLFAFDPRRQAILLLGGDRPMTGTSGTSGTCQQPMISTTNT